MYLFLMGRALRDSKPKKDEEMLRRKGFSKLDECLEDDPQVCPFGSEGYCTDIKDRETYLELCAGPNYSFSKCKKYNNFINIPELYLNQPDPSDGDTEDDTVEMHGDEVVVLGNRDNKENYGDSIHDQIADGVNIKKFLGCRSRNSLRSGCVDEIVERTDLSAE